MGLKNGEGLWSGEYGVEDGEAQEMVTLKNGTMRGGDRN
jgi:hypothetical protein